MKKLSDIDKNFAIDTSINRDNIAFHTLPTDEIQLFGVFREGEKFRRLPEEVAKTVSEGVHFLHANTAGGRIRFKTDSRYVALYASLPFVCQWANASLCGIAGFDIYADGEYVRSYVPDYTHPEELRGIVDFEDKRMRNITINMPLYSDVGEVHVGLEDDCALSAPDPYKIDVPIVFYGSSITQGGCASRPGNAYQGFVSRALDADYINLGFSGNAKGEDEIADYVKGLKMSAFVYDYDFNAPDLAHLTSTHERMFLRVREANPTLPIIIMSKPKYKLAEADQARRDTIFKTYENALARGDENVYFISGTDLMEQCLMEGTVDGTHPNDLGFYSMASKLIPLLRDILK